MSDGTPGRRDRAKARMHRELRENALALFAQRGFDAVSVDDIVAATEVSQRTFFRYFPTKEDVALDVFEELAGAFVDRLHDCPPELGPFDALREVFRPQASTEPATAERELLVLRLAESRRA